MKKMLGIWFFVLVGGLNAFDIKYSADPAFCIRTQTELSVCSFSVPFYNAIKYAEMKKKEEAKKEKANKEKIKKLKQKIKFELKKACFIWDTMSPMAQMIIINTATNGDEMVAGEGEMEEVCLRIDEIKGLN